jgi:hypothetical protein
MESPPLNKADHDGQPADIDLSHWHRQNPAKPSFLDLPGEIRNSIYAEYFQGASELTPWETLLISFHYREIYQLYHSVVQFRPNKYIYHEVRSYFFYHVRSLESLKFNHDIGLFWRTAHLVPKGVCSEVPFRFCIPWDDGWAMDPSDQTFVENILRATAVMAGFSQIMDMMEVNVVKSQPYTVDEADPGTVAVRHNVEGVWGTGSICMSLSARSSMITYDFDLDLKSLQLYWTSYENCDGKGPSYLAFKLIGTASASRRLESFQRTAAQSRDRTKD